MRLDTGDVPGLDLDALADAIASRLRPAVDPGRLWSYDDIAQYAKLSASTVRRMEKTDPSFPEARRKQTSDDGTAVTRFVAREVIDWFERKPLSRAG